MAQASGRGCSLQGYVEGLGARWQLAGPPLLQGCCKSLPTDRHAHVLTKAIKVAVSFLACATVFQGMLVACDTGRLHVEETADILGTVLAVMAGQQAPGTYDVRSTACWSTYKKVLVVADKYDM